MLMQAIKRTRFWSFLLPGLLAVALTETNEAHAAPPAFQAFSAIAAAADTSADPTVTLPAHLENDVLLLATIVRSNTATVATPAGWTQIGSPTVRSTVATYQFFWIRAGATTVPNPLIDRTGTTGDVYAAVITYRGAITIGDPWEVKGTAQTGATDPSVFTQISTLTNDSLVVVAVAGEDNNNGSIISTGTDPAAYTEHYVESATGADGVITFSEAARTTAGATGNVSVNWDTNFPVGFGGIVLALRPRGTILGNAITTDPGNTTLAPGPTTAMADAFTFQTGTGMDVITAVVVGLSAGSAGGLSLVEITNDAGTTVYGSVTDPASDTPSISLGAPFSTLTATTTLTQYKIRITPKSHAAMPAPPGSLYSVTAKINSWTSTGIPEGSDTAGTTVTIDNESSGDVSAASGTSGDTQVTLNWTNPTVPTETVAYSVVVLRSTAAVADTPVEGTTYAVGNTIGASTVRCVVTGLPPALTCTDTGLTNGTAYHYKIFTRDSNGNFSPGVVPTGSPFTPAPNRYAVATGNWNAVGTWSSAACGLPQTATTTPTVQNNVIICASAVTVTITAAGAACAGLTFDAAGAGVTLQHNAGIALSVLGSVNINGSTVDGTKAWNIDAGSATVGGNVALNGGTGNARIARINITTGTLTIKGGLTYNSANAVRAVIDMSGGAGVLNLAGALTINTTGTLTTPSPTSTFNFNGTAAGQTIPLNVSNVIYNNLHVNNTHASGATLANDITAARVTGDLRVQSGTLNNGGFSIVGNAAKTFEVANGATFVLTGGSVMATGFGTKTFGATSTVRYARVGGNQNVSIETYGHLVLTGGGNKRLLTGTTTIIGNFTLETGTTYDGPANDPTVNLAGNFSNSGTFNAGTGVFTFNGTAAQTITGATTFGNLVINNSNIAGVTANSDLSITRNFTNTAGFDAVTNSITTTFNGTVNQTITGATTFHNLTLSNTFGSGTELTLSNNVTVNNTLSFVAGNVITGANTLIIGNTTGCGVTGAGTGVGYIVGNLRKNFTASLLSCPFEIGNTANGSEFTIYTPVSALTFASVTTPGTVTATTTGADCADLGNSGINTGASVNRCWTLTAGGLLDFTTCGMTFDYIDPDDLDGGVLTDDFIIRRKDGGIWSVVSVSGTPTTTQTSGTGATAFGDFAIGNPGFIYTRESEFIYTRELYY
ncbi:MAG: hypothetical protein AAB294_03255 [Pseudomonadota bacterium]